MDEFLRAIQERYHGGFQPYAAGNKRYGASGRDAPNIGPTANRVGYAERDAEAKRKREVMLKKMQSMQGNAYMRSPYLRNTRPGSFRM